MWLRLQASRWLCAMTALAAQPTHAYEHARGAHQQAAQAEGQQQRIPQRPALQQRQPVPAVQHGEQPALEALGAVQRSEEHTSELQSPCNLVCRLLLEQK